MSKSNKNFLELLNDLAPVCPPNEVLSNCVNECGHTCIDFARKNVCPLFCKLNACTCKSGYVRDPKTKKCVKPEDCSVPPQCRLNERYYTCSSCIGTCDRPIPRCPRICRRPANCDCNPGLVRNALNVCVRPDQCPKTTPTITPPR